MTVLAVSRASVRSKRPLPREAGFFPMLLQTNHVQAEHACASSQSVEKVEKWKARSNETAQVSS